MAPKDRTVPNHSKLSGNGKIIAAADASYAAGAHSPDTGAVFLYATSNQEVAVAGGRNPRRLGRLPWQARVAPLVKMIFLKRPL